MARTMTVKEAGRKGGKARAANLSKEERIRIAKLGYNASSLSTKNAQPNEAEKKDENSPCA